MIKKLVKPEVKEEQVVPFNECQPVSCGTQVKVYTDEEVEDITF